MIKECEVNPDQIEFYFPCKMTENQALILLSQVGITLENVIVC